ncbi:RNA 2',3'-cyclic phosphodiesterase [Candidatus Micrarchaeota archaeon]|nr:MAG: RNA 2',3'-cyclic phosphodiesterase [Candidatus Micrarchaeota archaeon]
MRAFIGIAVPPLPKIVKALNFLKRFDVKCVEKENLHINIVFLGDIREEKANEIADALDCLEGFGSFKVRVSYISAFPSKERINVIWASAVSDKLMELEKKVMSLEPLKSIKKDKAFIPHITLARVKKRPPMEIREVFNLNDLGEFTAEGLVLYESKLTTRGPIYSKLHVVKL